MEVTKNFKRKEIIIIIAGKQQKYQNARITVSKKESKKKRKREHERENCYVFHNERMKTFYASIKGATKMSFCCFPFWPDLLMNGQNHDESH